MQGGQDQDLKAASTAKLVQDQSKLLVIVSKDKKGTDHWQSACLAHIRLWVQ